MSSVGNATITTIADSSKSDLFDTQTCKQPSMQNSYRKVCESQNSNNISQCVQKLTDYCQTNTYTHRDFNVQAKLLNCYITNKCNGDEKCMKSCETS